MTTKVRSILQSFNIPLSAYDSEIIAFDDIVAYFDTLFISASIEAKKSTSQLLQVQKQLDFKKIKIESLELQITKIMCDRDSLSSEVKLLLAQRNIYCISAKRLYAKLTALHHSSDIIKEQ